MTLLPLLLLCVLLALAVWHDLRARRIPNAIVFPGAVLALALHALLPAGEGLFGTPMGSLGLLSSLGGWALGLAFLMPMYALRLMGAGDVKLLAMVGAFVGAGQILTVGIATLLAGGVLALAVAAWQGSLRRVLNNTYQTMLHAGLTQLSDGIALPAAASGRLPYAVAIAGGTGACVAWLHLVGELPL
ncbi:prepilin peptidase [[Empedobacter] haloabium]|uniref:Prepilin peptidase n=1 Tax=[Empedobacter] haloabium TaxID=592317 RepID=A0ABZ1UKQ3_9BURK